MLLCVCLSAPMFHFTVSALHHMERKKERERSLGENERERGREREEPNQCVKQPYGKKQNREREKRQMEGTNRCRQRRGEREY